MLKPTLIYAAVGTTLFLVQFAVMRATGRHRARLATTSL